MNIVIPYNPRSVFLDFHKSKKRFAAIVAHRRCGKTVAAINELVKAILMCPLPNARGAYIAPTYMQAKDIAFTYLKDYCRNIPGIHIVESELRIDFPNGGRIKLYGADNPDRFRGLYFDYVVLDEYADMSSSIWESVIRPAIADRQGRVLFIGTPKGEDAFYEIYRYALDNPEDWYSTKLKASETGLLSPKELQMIFNTSTPETYAREMECDFSAAFPGAYYAKLVAKAEDEGRIRSVPYDASVSVFAAWDLGIGDHTAIWVFQLVGNEWHFLNYYENTGEGLDHYVNWIKKLSYYIDEHILPHDAEARELQSGKSRNQFLQERGLTTRVLERHKIEDGINAVRLAFNRFYFDKKATKDGIACLRMYSARYDEKKRTTTNTPVHNWASHGADALRYALMGHNELFGSMYKKSNWKEPISRESQGTYV